MSTATVNTPKFSKMGTEQLRKAIDSGKFEGDLLKQAQSVLSKRKKSTTTPPVKETKGSAKKESKTTQTKKVKEVKEKKAPPSKVRKVDGISGLVRKMILPSDGSKVCKSTYSQCSKAVLAQFGRKLYASEFDRNFKMLQAQGLVEKKRTPEFKGIGKPNGAK